MGGSTKVKKDKSITDAEKVVAAEYRSDFENFRTNVMPLINDQINSLDDRTIIKRSMADNADLGQRSKEQQDRMAARMDLGYSSPNQAAALGRQRRRNLASTMAGNENNARLVQKDRNDNVALNLASLGNNYRQQGLDDMMNAVGIGSNRAMANAQSASAARQQNIGTAASLATMAIMAF